MLIAIIAIFCAGIGNFAMHRAFMESDDPLIQQMVKPLADKVGPNITYIFEFLLLVGAMAIATRNWFAALRSDEHTSELPSLMRISYAVLRPTKKQQRNTKC